jgi:hypothetical protein
MLESLAREEPDPLLAGIVEERDALAVLHRDVAQGGQVPNSLTGKPSAGSPTLLKHRMRRRPYPGFHTETTSQIGWATTLEAVDFGLCIAG